MTLHATVALACDLVAIPSVSGSSGEGHVLEMLADRLSSRYDVRTTSDSRGLRAVAVVPRDITGDLLLFNGHVDVVPVGDETAWRRPPFEPEISDGRLWGRGSTDMKAGVAAAVTALESAPDAAQVAALFTVEEETGSRGASAAAAILGDVTTGLMVIGEPTDGLAIRGHKGVTWVRVGAAGVAAHGSTPHLGSNAIMRLGDALRRAESAVGPWETMNIGLVSGGSAINIVPARAEAHIDMRTTRIEADLSEWWREQPEVSDVDVLLDLRPVLLDPLDPVVAALGVEVTDRIAGYFTDAAVLVGDLGCDRVLLWGPGVMEQAHRLDEWVAVDAIERTHIAYGDLIRRWSTL